MAWPETTSEINFDELKEDLSTSMRICTTSPDQFNRVMITISELLYSGICNMQDETAFKSAFALEAAYGVISRCTDADNQYEIVLLKFARAFIPFMDYLGAHKLSKNGEAPSSKRVANSNPEKKKVVAKANVKAITRSGRTINTVASFSSKHTVSAASDSVVEASTSKVARRITLRQTGQVLSKSAEKNLSGSSACLPKSSMQFAPLVEPKYEDAMDTGIPSTSSCQDDSTDWIKQEEEDYDEVPAFSPGHDDVTMFHGDSTEVKKEVDDAIKEEPIEQPLADRVVIESRPGKVVVQPRRKISMQQGPITKQPHMSGHKTLQLFKPPHTCTYCYLRLPQSKMEQHVKMNHREKWLSFVRTCLVDGCDFRPAFPASIQQHILACHNQRFESWKKTNRFEFAIGTKCPYCPQQLTHLAQFVRHMEFYHPRLCTYEVSILKCDNCDFTCSRTYEMFMHWHSSTKCTRGMRFVYETAVRVLHTDLNRKKLENEPGAGTSQRAQPYQLPQNMPHLSPPR